ncbi:hypothetical protein [Sulfitobacter sp.]|uniref:hypothetical protein n=1 Tax=Sulfitobacter sp. TaxID=1903071 RepID=UPI0030032905
MDTILLGLEYQGTVYNSAETAKASGVPDEFIAGAQSAINALKGRDAIRSKIESDAGDPLSLLGTTSDAATIAVLMGACFMASLDETTSYGAFRTKANAYMQGLSGEHDPTEIAQEFLSKVASGGIRLPALEKGIVPVLAEVTARGNAVAEAINPSGVEDA